ncbi:MAG: uncharacterized protein KVP18_004301 [Porospora cf. gigantea A]|uniref:uncharacterized protein n=1 Tax=Porospora cf. gigantea A TaxID=2853593 RepID=UPI003559CBB6|nr:MAG: hypothetical protein KVP18_004301 [Porospora cf. gigantea A]
MEHSDEFLMTPPVGFKFIPKQEAVCGKSGCFDCFDIYCERCDSKDRRIVELEMRNNDLTKYITQLQGRVFGTRPKNAATESGQAGQPFGFVQSPVMYDPNLDLSYVATTSFAPAAGVGNT